MARNGVGKFKMDTVNKRQSVAAVFPIALRRFTESLDYLRTYIETIDKHITDEADQILRDNTFALSPVIFYEIDRLLADPLSTLSESDRARYRKIIDRVSPSFKDHITVTETEITIHDAQSRVGAAMRDAIKQREANARKSVLFLDGAVVMLVGMVEACVHSIVSLKYVLEPTIIDDSNHAFTLTELMRFTEIADARTFLIEKRVTDSMYGGLLTWIDLLKSTYHIVARYTDSFRPQLRELYLRRNVIAHSEGRAGKAYVAGAPSNQSGEPICIGDRLFSPKAYLHDALNAVESCFVLLGSEVWDRVTDGAEKDDIAAFLGEVTYTALRDERWTTAISTSQFVASDKKVGDTLRLMAQFNRWQAEKWSGNYSRIEPEVLKQDYNALNLQFQLAWLALTGNADEFFPLFESALKIGKLTSNQARDWPIFREMRKDNRFKIALAENGIESEVRRVDNEDMSRLLFASERTRTARADSQLLPSPPLAAVNATGAPKSRNTADTNANKTVRRRTPKPRSPSRPD